MKDYEYLIDEAIKKYNFTKIFLATDDNNILNEFKEKYKERLLYYKDVNRTDGTKSIVFENNQRENNNYLNGLEVLRDMYTLANCDGLIAGLSQVSFAARITKKSLNKEYNFLKIIDNGIIV